MESWPQSLLPDVRDDPFTQDTDHNILRSPGSGAVTQRPRFSFELKTNQIEWAFTQFQYAVFQSFLTHKISGGADFFLVDLPFGNGLEQVAARIVDAKYNASYQDGFWIVSAVLEVEQPPTS